MTAILIFIIATIVNVTLSTIRSLCTIKGGKWLSATTNAICFGFYPLIVMLTAKGTVAICLNMAITAIVNFICVWIIKFIEEKARKDKLWLVKCTIPNEMAEEMYEALEMSDIPYTDIPVRDYIVFDTYCTTQEETQMVKEFCTAVGGKMFATENKL